MKNEWKCGPAWLPDKANPALSDFFQESCFEHDKDYENNNGFWGKWKADWKFGSTNVRKALKEDSLFQKIRRLLEGVILFIMVKIPVISHASYVIAQNKSKDASNGDSDMQG